MLNKLFYLFLLAASHTEGVFSLFLLSFIIEMHVLNANIVDPDQMPCSARLIWVYTVCQCPVYGTPGVHLNELIAPD